MSTSATSSVELPKIDPELSQFAEFALRCAALYLGFGGSSGRVEAALCEASRSLGFRSEIMASPSGIYMSVARKGSYHVHTEIRRVSDCGLNLQQIEALEALLKNLRDQKISIQEAFGKIAEFERSTPGFSPFMRTLATFSLGCGGYLMHHSEIFAGLVAGLIAILVSWVAGPLAKRLHLIGIFGDFMACLTMLVAGLSCSYWLRVPFSNLVAGSLLYLVPGLTIITAVSEFSSYNYLSGTAKIMKGVFILLSLILGFALVDAFVTTVGVSKFEFALPVLELPSKMAMLLQNLFGTIVFLIIFQVPKKAFPGTLICGVLAYFILSAYPDGTPLILKYFTASFGVGVLSLLFGYLQRLPSQCFSVPGIYSMLPGLMAFSFLTRAIDRGGFKGIQNLDYDVLLIAVAVVFGLVMARIPFYKYSTFKDDHSHA